MTSLPNGAPSKCDTSPCATESPTNRVPGAAAVSARRRPGSCYHPMCAPSSHPSRDSTRRSAPDPLLPRGGTPAQHPHPGPPAPSAPARPPLTRGPSRGPPSREAPHERPFTRGLSRGPPQERLTSEDLIAGSPEVTKSMRTINCLTLSELREVCMHTTGSPSLKTPRFLPSAKASFT